MADTTPSLQEISSFSKDPDLVKGSPAVVLDISSGLKAVTEAAHERAQYDWLKYQNHLKQVNDFAQNHQLNFEGVMQEDIPEIEKESQKYYAKIAANPRLITQINQDGDWNRIQGMIAKSKGDNSLLKLQETFRDKNPDLLNDTNNKIALDYRNTGLSRNAGQIQWALPVSIDTNKLADGVLKDSGSHFANVQTENESGQKVPGYFFDVKGTKYDKNKFVNNWDGILDSNQKIDPYGHTARQAAENMFKRLPEPAKKIITENTPAGGDPIKTYWNKLGQGYYREKDITDSKPIEDKFAFETAKVKDDLAKMKVKFGYDVYLKELEGNEKKDFELWKDKLGLDKDKGGKWLNDFTSTFVADAIANPKAPGFSLDGSGKTYMEAPASEKVRELFGAEETNSIGKKIKIIPDKLVVSTDGSQIVPIYFNAGSKKDIIHGTINHDKSQPISIDDAKALFADKFKLTGSLEASNRFLLESGLDKPSLNDGNALKYIAGRSANDYVKEVPSKETTHVKSASGTDGKKFGIGNYPAETQTKIKNFMKSNNLSEVEAIKVLIDNNKL